MKSLIATLALISLSACQKEASSDVNGVPDMSRGRPGLEGEPTLVETPVSGGPTRNGSCSDANAELVYEVWNYQGGAAPMPGMTVYSQKLTYQGEAAGETVVKSGEGSTEVVAWTLNLIFVEGTDQTLESTGDQVAGSRTWAQQLEVRKVGGLGPTMDDNRFFKFVICTNSWIFNAP